MDEDDTRKCVDCGKWFPKDDMVKVEDKSIKAQHAPRCSEWRCQKCDNPSTNEEMQELIDKLNDDNWWAWVRGWLDTELIRDIYANWEDDVCTDEIPNLKAILARQAEEASK